MKEGFIHYSIMQCIGGEGCKVMDHLNGFNTVEFPEIHGCTWAVEYCIIRDIPSVCCTRWQILSILLIHAHKFIIYGELLICAHGLIHKNPCSSMSRPFQQTSRRLWSVSAQRYDASQSFTTWCSSFLLVLLWRTAEEVQHHSASHPHITTVVTLSHSTV